MLGTGAEGDVGCGEPAQRTLEGVRIDAKGVVSGSELVPIVKLEGEAGVDLHGHEGPAHELMRSADQQLTGKSIEEIFDLGLHQFLGEFIVRNQAVATAISEQYRFIG